MNPADSDDFFIGWRPRQPSQTRKAARTSVVILLLAAVACGIVFATAQRSPDRAAYEWSNVQTFAGVLRRSPYPHLLMPRGPGGGFSAYPLVGPTKFGITPEWCGDFDGRMVTFDGGLIFRSGGTLIEVVSEAPAELEASVPVGAAPGPIDFGDHALVGEIVDAKCFIGAMNPGRYKPHRTCATVCVAGGIPPMLAVNTPGGDVALFLLVGPDGEMINDELLRFIARPVRITGRLSLSHDLWILSADPETVEVL